MTITISKKAIAARKAATAAQAAATLSKALSLATPFPKNFVELAALLEELSSRPDLIEEFIAKSNIGKRKVQYLISMHQKFAELQVSPTIMIALGWTKLVAIQPILTPQNVDEFIAEAGKRTVASLQQYVKSKMPLNGAHEKHVFEDKPRVVVLRFTEGEYQLFRTALRDNGAEERGKGLKKQEAAILKIMSTAE